MPCRNCSIRKTTISNVVFADHALDIDNGRLYSTVSRENVEESSQIFTDMMGPMVSMLAAISALIFMIVMYLMMKVMIDRSAFSISLMKVFGYRKGEIRRLYLDGNFYIIMLGALLGVPLAKWSMDLIFPYFYFQCGHRNGFTVPAAVVRHDLRRHPDLLSGDQLPAGGQTEQAGACGSIEE